MLDLDSADLQAHRPVNLSENLDHRGELSHHLAGRDGLVALPKIFDLTRDVRKPDQAFFYIDHRLHHQQASSLR